ncbi:cupin domain-containing protein [Chryseobacterium sp. Tr-659]|uniref:cupin domain-containing protein n=1 Tax=Chryseobacterium sp. Tr-659 TaxID=2608340 RepID=UPI001421AAEA|nr:cupin domain-containing protein [Chryseobacterium sp. Tr-659]NIF05340.1 cupin domain-containing protein [Chryseobacterium sp. Tr-659]
MEKSTIINPAGNWDFWEEKEKRALESGAQNFNLGDRIVLENDEFTVWSIHLSPGDSLPFHIHKNRYFWSALSPGTARSWYNDGSVAENQYECGDTVYFDDLNEENHFIHNLENIGETTLIFLTVEFKK